MNEEDVSTPAPEVSEATETTTGGTTERATSTSATESFTPASASESGAKETKAVEVKVTRVKKNRTLHKDRSYLQDKTPVTSLPGTVRYRLEPIASNIPPSEKMKKDRKVYYARVVPWRTLTLDDLLQRMDDERLAVSRHTARMVLLTAMDTLVQMLKEGNQVTIDDFFTFGLSIPGRVGFQFSTKAKSKEQEAIRAEIGKLFSMDATVRGKLSVHPWIRYSPAMLDALNKGVKISHMGSTQPVPTPLITIRRTRKPKAPKS